MKYLIAFLIISNSYAGEVLNVDLAQEKQTLELCRADQNLLKFHEDITGIVSSKTLQKSSDLDINYQGKFIVVNNQIADGSIVVSSAKAVSLIHLHYKDCKVSKFKKISLE